MAFTTIPQALIKIGAAVQKQLFQLTKDNLDQHEADISALQTSQSFITLHNDALVGLSNYAPSSGTLEGLWEYQAQQAISLTSLAMSQTSSDTKTSGEAYISGGTEVALNEWLRMDITQIIPGGLLEFDILKGTDPSSGGDMTSIYSTKPSLTLTGNPGRLVFEVTGEVST